MNTQTQTPRTPQAANDAHYGITAAYWIKHRINGQLRGMHIIASSHGHAEIIALDQISIND